MKRLCMLGLAAALCYLCDTACAQNSNAADPRAAQALADEKQADRGEAKANAARANAAEEARKRKESDVAKAMIVVANDAMSGKVWRASGRNEQRQAPANDKTGKWSKPLVTDTYTGLVSGDDFDVTELMPGDPNQTRDRRIALKEKVWQSIDGGATWNDITEDEGPRGNARWWSIPLPADTCPLLEIMGREKHEDGTWVHIGSPGELKPNECSSEWWILVDAKGWPVCVRRVVTRFADITHANLKFRCLETVNFTPAKKNQGIAGPKATK